MVGMPRWEENRDRLPWSYFALAILTLGLIATIVLDVMLAWLQVLLGVCIVGVLLGMAWGTRQ